MDHGPRFDERLHAASRVEECGDPVMVFPGAGTAFDATVDSRIIGVPQPSEEGPGSAFAASE
jgi:hypothetical protein